METLRIGKAVELLWRESTSMNLDEEFRLEILSKCMGKRLELMLDRDEESSRLIEEKVIRSKRNQTKRSKQNLFGSLQKGSGRYANADEGFDRYYSGHEGRGEEDIWNMNEFGDMDQFEKMMLMKSFKKKKEAPQTGNGRYNENFDERSQEDSGTSAFDFSKGFDPKMRRQRKKQSILLIKVMARFVLNMIKHQSKRNEIGAASLKRHKEIGYQMLRKSMKGFEQEVNREEEVELFIERFCPEEVNVILDEFKQGGASNRRQPGAAGADPGGLVEGELGRQNRTKKKGLVQDHPVPER